MKNITEYITEKLNKSKRHVDFSYRNYDLSEHYQYEYIVRKDLYKYYKRGQETDIVLFSTKGGIFIKEQDFIDSIKTMKVVNVWHKDPDTKIPVDDWDIDSSAFPISKDIIVKFEITVSGERYNFETLFVQYLDGDETTCFEEFHTEMFLYSPQCPPDRWKTEADNYLNDINIEFNGYEASFANDTECGWSWDELCAISDWGEDGYDTPRDIYEKNKTK